MGVPATSRHLMAGQAWEVWIDFPSKPSTAEAQQSREKCSRPTHGESQRWAHPDGEGGRAWTLVDMQTDVGEVPGGGVGS